MGKYLKKFETVAQYTAAQPNLILPNVSLITETNGVAYNPASPAPSYEYIDLGLPSGTKWATMNVGASSETDYGNYYQYGKGAGQYAATSGESIYASTENPLAASADTAVQVWGGDWHMPTDTQFNELMANTTYEWATINGVNGGKFTATNGNYVFFPAAGNWDNGSQTDVGTWGYYWTSTPTYNASQAGILYLGDGDMNVSFSDRSYGFSVRPVMDA